MLYCINNVYANIYFILGLYNMQIFKHLKLVSMRESRLTLYRFFVAYRMLVNVDTWERAYSYIRVLHY